MARNVARTARKISFTSTIHGRQQMQRAIQAHKAMNRPRPAGQSSTMTKNDEKEKIAQDEEEIREWWADYCSSLNTLIVASLRAKPVSKSCIKSHHHPTKMTRLSYCRGPRGSVETVVGTRNLKTQEVHESMIILVKCCKPADKK